MYDKGGHDAREGGFRNSGRAGCRTDDKIVGVLDCTVVLSSNKRKKGSLSAIIAFDG